MLKKPQTAAAIAVVLAVGFGLGRAWPRDDPAGAPPEPVAAVATPPPQAAPPDVGEDSDDGPPSTESQALRQALALWQRKYRQLKMQMDALQPQAAAPGAGLAPLAKTDKAGSALLERDGTDQRASPNRLLKFMPVRAYRPYRAYRAFAVGDDLTPGSAKDCAKFPFDRICHGTSAHCAKDVGAPECAGTQRYCEQRPDATACFGTEAFCFRLGHTEACAGTAAWCLLNKRSPACAGMKEVCEAIPTLDLCFGTAPWCAGNADHLVCQVDER